jgi:transposase-like protein
MVSTRNIDLPTLAQSFASEDACHDYLEALRWPKGVTCPGRINGDGKRHECGSKKFSRLAKRRLFECQECGYQFSTRVGTIFEDTKLPLWKWFLAVYLMIQSRKGISANQLKRMLAVSYKTAWFLSHRIRAAMKEENPKPLSGKVEIDETFVGGKGRYPDYSYLRFGRKEIVMAAVERGGSVRFKVVPNRGKRAMHRFVKEVTADETETYYTDEHKSYGGIGDSNTKHETVNHSKNEWVVGQAHTNTIEGVFSLLKRSIVGSYHKVSAKHLPAYLDEVAWRYSNRKNDYLFRDTILELIRAERLEYKKLTAS